MDEDVKKSGKNHNLLKGIVYTGIAGVIGVCAYLVAKYKHLGGRTSYTVAGIALLVSAPSLIGVLKTHVDNRARIEVMRIYSSIKKDSIDAVLRMNAPKDTSTFGITDMFTKSIEASKALEEKYNDIISDNSKQYETLLEKKDEQYTSTVKDLRDKTEKLQNTIEELKNVRVNTSDLETIASQNRKSSSGIPETIASSYYFIDADKSNGEIQVYGIYSDGTKKNLSIASKASFAMNGGPANGNYVLRNKGARRGELYPGFLEMDNPVGISGAGEYNQYLDDIQEGALANKTGIRVPNEIYNKIARLVDEKKTVINVHE